MKITLSIALILLLAFNLKAQQEKQSTKEVKQEISSTKEVQEGLGELQNQVKSLFDYYEKYDENTSKKDKKEALDKAIDDMAGKGTVSEKDKSDAFKVIDAYISADKAPTQIKSEKKQIAIEDSPEVKEKAQEYFDAAKNKLLSMSYAEYEKNIWITKPMASRREIKESYNQIHQNDGKSVSISASDNELSETQKQVNAFYKMENAKTYEEYKEAIKELDPNASDERIRKAWNNK